jgi:hypothetical protein
MSLRVHEAREVMSLPGRPLPSEDETTFRRRNNLEGLKDF